MKKKILFTFAALLISLSACSTNADTPETPPAAESETLEETKHTPETESTADMEEESETDAEPNTETEPQDNTEAESEASSDSDAADSNANAADIPENTAVTTSYTSNNYTFDFLSEVADVSQTEEQLLITVDDMAVLLVENTPFEYSSAGLLELGILAYLEKIGLNEIPANESMNAGGMDGYIMEYNLQSNGAIANTVTAFLTDETDLYVFSIIVDNNLNNEMKQYYGNQFAYALLSMKANAD